MEEVRTVVHGDGTRSEFRRDRRSRVVIRRRFDAAGMPESTTVYRVAKGNKVLSSRVLDARGEDLYQCRYGYSVADGSLVEEQVHRADRAARMATDSEPGVTYRVLYSAGADGQIGSQVIKVDLSEKDSEQDGVERPKGIPSAPFEIPWEEL